jgi:DnaJ-class molecular chaperone
MGTIECDGCGGRGVNNYYEKSLPKEIRLFAVRKCTDCDGKGVIYT